MNRSESELLRVVNATRAANGLATFRVDVALQRAARAHTVRMATTGTFTHGNFVWRMRRYHVRGPTLGENIGWASGAAEIVGMWLESPHHRANLLRAGFRRIGVGVQVDGSGTVIATTDFAGT